VATQTLFHNLAPGALTFVNGRPDFETPVAMGRARSEQSVPHATATTLALNRVRAAQSPRRFG
jgi:hypothetical protein